MAEGEIERLYKDVIGSLNEIAGDIRELTNEIKHTVDALNENKKIVAEMQTDISTLKSNQDKAIGGVLLIKVVGGFAIMAFSTIAWWAFQNVITLSNITTKQAADIEYLKKDKDGIR